MLPLTDLHQHTNFSPCGVDVSVSKNPFVAYEKGLKIIALTDHGFCKKPSWLEKYFKDISAVRKSSPVEVLSGIEVNVDYDGKPVVDLSILKQFDVVVAAVHKYPRELRGAELYDWWRRILARVAEENFALVLAHPTDIGWFKLRPPLEYCLEVIDAIIENGLVVELNYHHKDPSDYFLKLCIDRGVLITPTSDAHLLSEIGNLEWHKSRVERLGYSVDEVNWLSERKLYSRLNL